MKKLGTLAFATLGLTLGSYAFGQANSDSASASATATIITPISISKSADLNFGSVIAGGSTGTVVLSTAGVRSATDGATLGSGSLATAAAFAVSGQASATYTITLPSSPITVTNGASDTMTVDAFGSNPSGAGTLNGSGNQTVNVGARLNVGITQATGVYTGSFDVSVAYN